MHELAVCQSMLISVEQTARQNGAARVLAVHVQIGPLSGVEAPLLQRAWTVARAGTCAAEAELNIAETPIVIACSECGHEGPAQTNRLVCEACGDWRVSVVSGEEMLLASLELETTAPEETEETTRTPLPEGAN